MRQEAPRLLVWEGHSFGFGFEFGIYSLLQRTKVKSGGHECPSHMRVRDEGRLRMKASRLAS